MRLTFSPVAEPTGRRTALLPETLPGSVDEALVLAEHLGRRPADCLADQWETLATLAAHDLGVARAVEPHLDAIDILAQAGYSAPTGRWGVFAAEGGDDPLRFDDDGTVSGTKPWCSLAGKLDSALVTISGGDDRQLFAVDLRHPGVNVDEGVWVARGLTEIPSGPVRFDSVPAIPVGDPGWYLTRAGFAWGGIGVAACWYGGLVGVARTVHAAAQRKSDPILFEHLGAIDDQVQASRRALSEAARLIRDEQPDPRILAKRVRATVARACDEVLQRAGHALGPAPLALDPVHSKRVADLQLYVRQHHAERDIASLGEALAKADAPW